MLTKKKCSNALTLLMEFVESGYYG
jgi:hypothetical protein